MRSKSRSVALALSGVLAGAAACQSMLGFEDFEGGSGGGSAGSTGNSPGGVDGDGRQGGASGVDAGAFGSGGARNRAGGGAAGTTTALGGSTSPGGSSTAGGSAGNTARSDGGTSIESSGGASFGNAAGDPCGVPSDCLGELACVYGRCRAACRDETECEQASVCLVDGTIGGCRLAGESSCRTGTCENAQLVCGLDQTCRVGCSDTHSCDASTQRCIAGTCVSTLGQDAALFDCGAHEEGEVLCEDRALSVCNALAPGILTVATCPSAGICEASVIASSFYDPGAPPSCVPGCEPGQSFCAAAILHECMQDGTGPVDSGQLCATAELCESALEQGLSACPEPACAEGQTRCTGASTQLVGQACNAGRTAFQILELCDTGGFQCNPTTGHCVSIAVDPTEVSRGEYSNWAASTDTETITSPPGCSWNDSLAPNEACMASANCSGAEEDCPIVCIDWCDARAYCEAQGRRLCGIIGGGMVPFEDYADPGLSEWMNACSAAAQFVYAHGDSVPETAADQCAYAGNSGGSAFPVGSRTACHSPGQGYMKLYDLSGNVAEWEDSCTQSASAQTAGPTDACRTRGGSYDSPVQELQCAAVPTIPHRRDAVAPTLGFRCCQG